MDRSSTKSVLQIILGQVGLILVVGGITCVIGFSLLLFPPWKLVRCERREVLYFSEVERDLESKFVGFHPMLGNKDWQTEKETQEGFRHSGELFEATDYRIAWGILLAEWGGLALAGLGIVALVNIWMYSNSKSTADQLLGPDEMKFEKPEGKD